MDIMELGAIGELVGGVAVIASLLYVGLQVRQSNRMEMAESARASTRDYIVTFHGLDAELFTRAVLDFEAIGAAEKQTLHQQLYSLFTVAQTEFSLSRSGLSDPETFEVHAQVFATLLRAPGVGQWWRTANPLFEDGFRAYMDQTIAAQRGKLPAFHELLPWLSGESAGGRA